MQILVKDLTHNINTGNRYTLDCMMNLTGYDLRVGGITDILTAKDEVNTVVIQEAYRYKQEFMW